MHCIALQCIALHCIWLHCVVLHCVALRCRTMLPSPRNQVLAQYQKAAAKVEQEHTGPPQDVNLLKLKKYLGLTSAMSDLITQTLNSDCFAKAHTLHEHQFQDHYRVALRRLLHLLRTPTADPSADTFDAQIKAHGAFLQVVGPAVVREGLPVPITFAMTTSTPTPTHPPTQHTHTDMGSSHHC